MNVAVKPARTVRCPGCGTTGAYSTENPFRPFCSARCKNHDFGAWASEDYTVPAPPGNSEDVGSDDPLSR